MNINLYTTVGSASKSWRQLMSCTNPNCECKAGNYANLNPPRRVAVVDAELAKLQGHRLSCGIRHGLVCNCWAVSAQMETLQRDIVERSKARRVRRGAAAYAVTIAGLRVELKMKSNNSFSVIYGGQFKDGLTYADAAHELGECIMHALALEGKLD